MNTQYRAFRLTLILSLIRPLSACTVAFDLSSLDKKCDLDQKLCDGKCVPNTDPATGCNEQTCAPCAYEHGAAECNGEKRCVLKKCFAPWDNCDFNSENGCETNTDTNPNHCHACLQKACSTPLRQVTETACLQDTTNTGKAECGIAQCDLGYGDCNRIVTDGCETSLISNDLHCGSCGNSCPVGTTCQRGLCVAASDAASSTGGAAP